MASFQTQAPPFKSRARVNQSCAVRLGCLPSTLSVNLKIHILYWLVENFIQCVLIVSSPSPIFILTTSPLVSSVTFKVCARCHSSCEFMCATVLLSGKPFPAVTTTPGSSHPVHVLLLSFTYPSSSSFTLEFPNQHLFWFEPWSRISFGREIMPFVKPCAITIAQFGLASVSNWLGILK